MSQENPQSKDSRMVPIKRVGSGGIEYTLIPLDNRLGKRIARDIDYTLQQGWADEISERDFYHGHVVSDGYETSDWVCDKQLALHHKDIPGLEGLAILYHTHEFDDKMTMKRNILSENGQNPVVLDPSVITDVERKPEAEEKIRKLGTFSVCVPDLNRGYSLFDVFFEISATGRYNLSNGSKIEVFARQF